jgi:hypothetical protein
VEPGRIKFEVNNMWMIVGLLIGLIGAGVGIYFALYAAGFFQYLGGKKASASAVSKDELTQRLLALNAPSRPYHIAKGEDTDLVVEWNIVNANWYGIFSKNRLSETYRASLLLDEGRHSVRCYEEMGRIEWSAGTRGLVPHVHYQKNTFGGRVLYKKEWGKGYGIKQLSPMEAGEVYDYNFDINEIRDPIEAAVTESGWEWVPVTGRKNATYKSLPATAVAARVNTIFCSHCGEKVSSDTTFCPHCGAKL